MGFMRLSLVFIVGIVLLLSLIIGNSLLVVSSALEYKNLQENVKPIIAEAISKDSEVSNIEENFNAVKTYCEEKALEISIVEESQEFEIDCDLVLASTPENFLDKQAEKFIEENYYKKYECGFVDCFKEQDIPFFLMSEQTKDYVKGKYYLFLGISSVLALGMFLLVEGKKNFLILLGILLIISSLPFMFLNNVSLDETSSQIFSIFIEQAQSVFWWMIVIGLIVGGLGIGLKCWNFDGRGGGCESKTTTPKKKSGPGIFDRIKKVFERKGKKK
jgi:hypothetical protein